MLAISIPKHILKALDLKSGDRVLVLRGTDADAGYVALQPGPSTSVSGHILRLNVGARSPRLQIAAATLGLRAPDKPTDVPHRIEAAAPGGPTLILDCRALVAKPQPEAS